VTELAAAIRTRELSPMEVTDAFIAQAEATHDAIHALVVTCFDDARREARAKTDAFPADPPPLFGVPCTVKDCLDARGLRSTCGLTARATRVATEDAHVLERVRAARVRSCSGRRICPTIAGRPRAIIRFTA
jgi:Asp-tRNA(Asn)/Glu-tRNA(Gln) amidotransferase A subunit family amidase